MEISVHINGSRPLANPQMKSWTALFDLVVLVGPGDVQEAASHATCSYADTPDSQPKDQKLTGPTISPSCSLKLLPLDTTEPGPGRETNRSQKVVRPDSIFGYFSAFNP